MKTIRPEQVEQKKRNIRIAACEIMEEEGLDKLSIRKISSRLSQTPGNIYHYYKDKEEILTAIVQEGYQEIMTVLMNSAQLKGDAELRLRCTLFAYIELMMRKANVFQILLRSRDPKITSQIHLLKKDIRSTRKSIDMLCRVIEQGVEEGIFSCHHVELRAQCIWCSVFGLIERMLAEDCVPEMQKLLIEEELQFIISSLRS